jgi:MFS family permease
LNYNWAVTGAVLPALFVGLPASAWQIALIVVATPVGQGVAEIPGGMLALRIGPGPVTMLGGTVLGLCALASAASSSWGMMATLRLGLGVGSGLFWPSSLALVRVSSPFRGFPTTLGVYNASGSVALIAALVGGLAIEGAFGWRASLLAGGAAQLACMCAVGIAFRGPTTPTPDRIRPSQGVSAQFVFRSRSLWALTLAGAGTWALLYILPQFALTFATMVHPTWNPTGVAAIVSTAGVIGIPAGILGGILATRTGRLRALLLISASTLAAVAVLIPFVDLATFDGIILVFGAAEGVGFAVLYAIPARIPEIPSESLPLAIGVLDSVETLAGSGLALGFGLLAGFAGFELAWIVIGIAAVVPLVLLRWVRERRGP